MNKAQRAILIVTGILLLLSVVGAMDGYDSNPWLALALFIGSIVCFYKSAQSSS